MLLVRQLAYHLALKLSTFQQQGSFFGQSRPCVLNRCPSVPDAWIHSYLFGAGGAYRGLVGYAAKTVLPPPVLLTVLTAVNKNSDA